MAAEKAMHTPSPGATPADGAPGGQPSIVRFNTESSTGPRDHRSMPSDQASSHHSKTSSQQDFAQQQQQSLNKQSLDALSDWWSEKCPTQADEHGEFGESPDPVEF